MSCQGMVMNLEHAQSYTLKEVLQFSSITTCFSVRTIVLIEIVTLLLSWSLSSSHIIHQFTGLSHTISITGLSPFLLSIGISGDYFAPLYTPVASPPSYVYPNHLPLSNLPRVPPGELADGEFLSNAMLSLKYKSSPFIGENSVDKNVPEHIQIGMFDADYAMMICPLVCDPFLDCLIHFQREPPLPDHFFGLETVELRGLGGEPEEIILVNHVPTLWIDKNIPLIPGNLPCPTLQITCHLAHLMQIDKYLHWMWYDDQKWQILSLFLATWTAYHSQDYFLLWQTNDIRLWRSPRLAFPMQSYHQTPQIPVHHWGFKIFVHDSVIFNQGVIDIWNAAVSNDTINPFVIEMYVNHPGMYEHLEGDIIHQPDENEIYEETT